MEGMARLILRSSFRRSLFLLALSLAVVRSGLAAIHWLPFGPDGGDARAFAVDPHDHKHLYLGAANGWMYESTDGGTAWHRLAQVGKRDDLVLDNIVVDEANSKRLLVGAWVLGNPDGGLFLSTDGGASWTSNPAMRGESIIALAQAPSDPKVLVAGTLLGVFRSTDGGTEWTQISPRDSKEIHNVESVAIDPKDPQIIYAGTWHLPWKTTDGGKSWSSIKKGIAVDSDVFSIIIDPSSPKTVYASACSGVYKSDDAGEFFQKVQGASTNSAHRTRVLMQDPNHRDTVFAGTTEGLFRSDDAGMTWKRTTGAELIVNDVFVDPDDSRKVMLATDRSGVLVSDDGGDSFKPANQGFSARQITAFAQQRERPAVLYIGVVNDKEWGGVFQSDNGGLNWVQVSAGLFGRDVLSLAEAPDGGFLAGTSHGIFRLSNYVWQRIESPILSSRGGVAGARTTARRRPVPLPSAQPAEATSAPDVAASDSPLPRGAFDGAVFAMATSGNSVLAATSSGLLISPDSGAHWGPVTGVHDDLWRFVATAGSFAVVATLHSATLSPDGGATWKPILLPEGLTQLGAIAVEDSGQVWVGGREGIFYSADNGATWNSPRNLFLKGVTSIFYDQPRKNLLVTASGEPTVAFTIHLPAMTASFHDTGWNLRFVRAEGDHLLGATLFDGIVVQPRMVASPIPLAGGKQ
jgi:photosystem II stability/assembly factor-like uncharacterized protein